MTTDDTRDELPPRVADYLATELRAAERDFRPGVVADRGRRTPWLAMAGVLAAAVLAVVVVLPRFASGPSVADGPLASGVDVASQAAEQITVSVPDVRCGEAAGRLSAEDCDAAIAVVRAKDRVVVDAADVIVIEDTCPKDSLCDRQYAYDSLVAIRLRDGSQAAYNVAGIDGFDRLVPFEGEVPAYIASQLNLHGALASVPTTAAAATVEGVTATATVLLGSEASTHLVVRWSGMPGGTIDPPAVTSVVHDGERLAIIDRAPTLNQETVRLGASGEDVSGHWTVTITPRADELAPGFPTGTWTLEFDVVRNPAVVCGPPPAGEDGGASASPIHALLTCEAAVAAANSAIGPDAAIAYIEFQYGDWCPPTADCIGPRPDGTRGYVAFHVKGRRLDTIVPVTADATGAVTAAEPFEVSLSGS